MALYEVTREGTKATTRVRAENRESAALKGAIKLGIRYQRRFKPTLVNKIKGDDSYWQVYCYDKALSASNNLHDPVIVSEVS